MLDKPGDYHNIKLIDFGTGLLWDNEIENIKGIPYIKIYERKGTLNYMAPEVINADKNDDEENDIYINELCDMWSIGIIAYVLLTQTHPFPEGKKLPNENLQSNEIKRQIKEFKLEKDESHKIFEKSEFKKISSENA